MIAVGGGGGVHDAVIMIVDAVIGVVAGFVDTPRTPTTSQRNQPHNGRRSKSSRRSGRPEGVPAPAPTPGRARCACVTTAAPTASPAPPSSIVVPVAVAHGPVAGSGVGRRVALPAVGPASPCRGPFRCVARALPCSGRTPPSISVGPRTRFPRSGGLCCGLGPRSLLPETVRLPLLFLRLRKILKNAFESLGG